MPSNMADLLNRPPLQCSRPGCACAKPWDSRNVQRHCPRHQDDTPSLSVRVDGNKLLVFCHACGPENQREVWDKITAPVRHRARGGDGARSRRVGGAPTEVRQARYEVRDLDGHLVAVHVRKDRAAGKAFRWERPDGTIGLGGAPVSALPLYGAHLLRDRPGEPVIVTEGEKAARALLNTGRLAVGTVTGAAGTPTDDVLHPLAGRDVLPWADADETGRGHMDRIGAALVRIGAASVRLVVWAEAPDAGDAVDFLAQHGAGEALDQLLTAAVPYPAEKPIFAGLLADVEAFLSRFVAFANPHQSTACALWCAHTYVWDAFDVSPFLHVNSPEKRSGKTRLLEALEVLVRAPWRVVSPSEAVLFRKIDAEHPTLLLDEVDAIFRGKDIAHEPLRALLNAGNRRGVKVPRCAGEGRNVPLVDFDVFTPRVLAGIGALPDTVGDRSIPVRLQRCRPHDVPPFRYREANSETGVIREVLAQWALRATPALQDARPDIPAALHDRAGEVWEPLLAIADAAGGEWPQRARDAAVALHGDATIHEETAGITTLWAIRGAFDEREEAHLATADLLRALVDRDDGPWSEWWAKQVDAGDYRGSGYRLARLLKKYGIAPVKIRVGEGTVQGYRRADFEDAWARYPLPASSPPPKGRNYGTSLDGQSPAHDLTIEQETTTEHRQPLQEKACSIVPSFWPSEGRGTPRHDEVPRVEVAKDGTTPSAIPAPSTDDGRRLYLCGLAESWGWPCLYLGWGVTVAPGEAAWGAFLGTASDDHVRFATEDLIALEVGRP